MPDLSVPLGSAAGATPPRSRSSTTSTESAAIAACIASRMLSSSSSSSSSSSMSHRKLLIEPNTPAPGLSSTPGAGTLTEFEGPPGARGGVDSRGGLAGCRPRIAPPAPPSAPLCTGVHSSTMAETPMPMLEPAPPKIRSGEGELISSASEAHDGRAGALTSGTPFAPPRTVCRVGSEAYVMSRTISRQSARSISASIASAIYTRRRA